ncbi:hydroxyethylthiazole kinase [Herbiconiux sp. P16]|uniref:hydroxyethylthiazole kinase n=1 Tax=Herbiconiux wuyangfengii TaxID=3342794 RepID=UPI0035B74959
MSRMSIRTSVHPSDLLATLREREPLVQCVTNAVVTGFTANALLAIGASAAMCDIPGEAGPFARIASGLLVNLGTPTAEQRDAAREAVAAARQEGTPWVLDPVAVGALPIRTALAHELLEFRPAIVRGNASEIIALSGAGSGGRGVDAVDTADDALEAGSAIARRTGGVVAISAPVDIVTDGFDWVRVANGHVLLTKVTGGGCALGAVMAAFLATASPFDAAVAASSVYGIAAEHAAASTSGPGSFAVGLLDALAAVTPAEVAAQARLS